MKEKVIIVGGGAAGFFAAINIARFNPKLEIIILEKTNQVLTKVKVSGGGRCNLTNANFIPQELAAYYPRGNKELLGPFHHFSSGDVFEWFESVGVPLKIEDDNRVFPASNSSQTIIDCFLSETKRLSIKIWTGTAITKISKKKDFELDLQDGQKINCEHLVLAIGGHQKQKHYDMISDLGHQIVSPIPSLFTFNLKKHPSNQLMGLSVNAQVRINESAFVEEGPLLFTHWGMSGPAILKLSSKAAKFLHEKNYQFNYSVSWLIDAQEWVDDARKNQGSKSIKGHFPSGFPVRLWHYLLDRSKIDHEIRWADLKKQDISALANVLSNDQYVANGKTTFKEEFVTCGGVPFNEINSKRMESKIVSNLFFCGEVINVDGYTGGFNFQSAWTTAWLVAKSFSK